MLAKTTKQDNATSEDIKQKHNKPLAGVLQSKFANVFREPVETGHTAIVSNWNFADNSNSSIVQSQKCTVHYERKAILMSQQPQTTVIQYT